MLLVMRKRCNFDLVLDACVGEKQWTSCWRSEFPRLNLPGGHCHGRTRIVVIRNSSGDQKKQLIYEVRSTSLLALTTLLLVPSLSRILLWSKMGFICSFLRPIRIDHHIEGI